MYEFRRTGPRPNLGHPTNRGKVGWWMGDTGRGFVDLLGNADTLLRPGANPFSFGGPMRPGGWTPAVIAPATNAGRLTWPAEHRLNNLTSGAAGFSVAYWTFRYAGTVSSFAINKGTVFATGNGTGWCTEESSNQRPRLTVGRATTRESWGTTDTLIIPAYTWTHVLWTWQAAGVTPICYVNGIAKAVSGVVTGSGAVSPEGTADGFIFFANTSQTWKDDFCVWNRALSAREVWEHFHESSTGYPNAMTRRAFVFTSPQAAPVNVDDETEDELEWDGTFFATSVDASTHDTLTWSSEFTAASFVDEHLFDNLIWSDTIFLLPDVEAFDHEAESEITWSGEFTVPPELRDELTWSGEFTIEFSYGQTSDTLFWQGRFLAITDELGSGRYRR